MRRQWREWFLRKKEVEDAVADAKVAAEGAKAAADALAVRQEDEELQLAVRQEAGAKVEAKGVQDEGAEAVRLGCWAKAKKRRVPSPVSKRFAERMLRLDQREWSD